MRIYISGPITGRSEEETKTEFGKAAAALKEMGHEVINPAEIMHWGLRWRDYMFIAEMIFTSGNIDRVFVLQGYKKSQGSKIEISWAKKLGIPITYQNESV